MKNLVTLALILVSSLTFGQIRTEKTISTKLVENYKTMALGEFDSDKTVLFFNCYQYKGISIIKHIELSLYDTERLYKALTDKTYKKGDVVNISTLDNKLININYIKIMFRVIPVFDIIDKNTDSVYHINTFNKKQLDSLFNKK